MPATTAEAKASKNSILLEKSKLHNELNRELRNAICCVNKMRCCKSSPTAGNIQIRAILVRCPNLSWENSPLTRRINRPVYIEREGVIKQFPGFDEDEPLLHPAITNCRKKLVITIKITNRSVDTSKNEYIVIDHVYDALTKKDTRLLTPYVIKIKQEPLSQMYGLKFLHVVNSLAHEEILNKHISNYTGCDTTSYVPTCGRITYKGKVIPFSQGFCCSCDAIKNTRQQPESLTQYSENLISYSDPAYLLDGVECPRNLRGHENVNQAKDLDTNQTTNIPVENKPIPQYKKIKGKQKNKYFSYSNVTGKDVEDYSRIKKQEFSDPLEHYFGPLTNFIQDNNEINRLESKIIRETQVRKRQVLSTGAQKRGGQNCADRYTPKGMDPELYHESTHCLRFSDLWYTVYHLQKPIIEHSILFQIFEKYEDINGKTVWRDLTKGKMARAGTIKKQFINEQGSISIKYEIIPQSVDMSSFSLNYKSALLLVPEGRGQLKTYPELQAGPPEYLIVHPSQISMEGDQCNLAGVGFEAFYKQPNRCSRPRGTCLTNQPHHLWKHDHEAEKLDRKGCFFLKHYGKLSSQPIRRNPIDGEQFLVLEYTGKFSNTIDVELKADFNTVLRPQSSGKITEVYVDSTSAAKTILTVKIANSGLISSYFIARLTDCPLEISENFNNVESKSVLIPPQHQHSYHLEIKCPLPVDRFHCSIEALNSKRELIALRRIRLQKYDRCICMWHCLCACVGSSEGLKCIPMSLQHYHAAGFQGTLPVTTFLVHYTFLDDALSLVSYILAFLNFLLLMLGFCKALVGLLCCPIVGQWGLDIILDLPRPMRRYYEPNLIHERVHYDAYGWPIHPDTKKRVRSMSQTTEIFLNIIFFYAYPFYIFMTLCRRILCPNYIVKKANSESSVCTTTSDFCEDYDQLNLKDSKQHRKASLQDEMITQDIYEHSDSEYVEEETMTEDGSTSDVYSTTSREGRSTSKELNVIQEVSEVSCDKVQSVKSVSTSEDDDAHDQIAFSTNDPID